MIIQFSDGEFSNPIATSLKMWEKINSFIVIIAFSTTLEKLNRNPQAGFRTLFWFFEQLANTRTSQSGENFNFSFCPEFPRFCFKSIRTDEERIVLKFPEYSEQLL